MKLAGNIHFYEGDYLKQTQMIYEGIGSSNFLVLSGKQNTMIDSGMTHGPHRKRLMGELKKDRIDLHASTNFVFSHAHPDHTLHAKDLCRGKEVNFMIHQDSGPLLSDDESQFGLFYDYPDSVLKEIFGVPVWLARKVLKYHLGFDYVRINKYFGDYDMLNFDTAMQVIPLPSHSVGHVGFHFPEHGIFYSSDLFDFRVAEGGIINNAQSSFEQTFRDIERVRALDVETLIPGHGRIVTGKKNVKTVLDRVTAGTKRYIVDIRDNLSKKRGGMTTSELTKTIFGKSIVYNESARKLITYNCLEHLRKNGETRIDASTGKVKWSLTW